MVTAYTWHQGGSPLKCQFDTSTVLLPDELLSSWILRMAAHSGCAPLSLTGCIWPDWRPWSVDIDREINPGRLATLSNFTGIRSGIIKDCFLSNFAQHVILSEKLPVGNWPWILSLGTRNRKHFAGHQVCPMCLQSGEPYYRLQWRFAWHTVCEKHLTPLIQRCPSCNTVLEPNQIEIGSTLISECSVCKFDIRKHICLPLSSNHLPLHFQVESDKVLKDGKSSYGSVELKSPEWFQLARFLVLLCRVAAKKQKHKLASSLLELGVPSPALCRPITGLALELLPVQERNLLFSGVDFLLSLPFSTLYDFLQHQLYPSFFTDPRVTVPNCFQSLQPEKEASKLKGSQRNLTDRVLPKPKTQQQVKQKWGRLLRKNHLNYEDL